jgi:hypothetical protein
MNLTIARLPVHWVANRYENERSTLLNSEVFHQFVTRS